jgi:hypothetical protein
MIGSWIVRFVLSLALGVAGAILLGPACVSIAHAQGIDSVGGVAVGSDLGISALVLLWAPLFTLLTEWFRGFVPAWRRGVNANPKALAAVDRFRALGGDPADVEVLRNLVVATGGPSDAAKMVLRVVPVVMGVAAPFVMSALPVDQTYNPGIVSALIAGLIAAQFGGTIMKGIRDRMPGAGAERAGSADEDPS